MKRILSIFVALIFCLSAFTGCVSGNKSKDNGKDGNDEAKNYIDLSLYKIVRPYTASSSIIKLTSFLKNSILENTKADLAVSIDDDEESEYEILIGKSDREEVKAAAKALSDKTKKEAYTIVVTDKKIVIYGLSDEDTIIGVKEFIKSFVKPSKIEKHLALEVGPRTLMKKTGEVLYVGPNFETLVLEERCDIEERITAETTYSYGKIIKLEHQKNEKNNGVLFAVSQNNNTFPWQMFRSDDDGKTWEKMAPLYDYVNKGNIPGYQPYLYELPEAMGKYPAGTILFAGCSRRGAKETTYIFVQATTDFGITWEPIGNVEIGGCYNQGDWSSDGLWEPVLMYEKETGRLYCYYSDELENGVGENHVGGHNQRLVYKYTTDLKSWSAKHDMVSLENPELRPGMVALTKMGNGKFALAYEMCGKGYSCDIHIKISDSLSDWDPTDKGKLVLDSVSGKGMASGPAIIWTPNGGDCGTLIVTSNSDRVPSTKTKCGLFLSFDYGKTFVTIENPIPNMVNDMVKSGYSPGFYVDSEGTIYYVNNPECYRNSFNEKLMFARIKVY